MAVMVVEVYEAFRSAGADDDKARKAAEVMAGDARFYRIDQRFTQLDQRLSRVEARLDMLTRMVGMSLTLSGGVFTGTILLLLRAFPAAIGR